MNIFCNLEAWLDVFGINRLLDSLAGTEFTFQLYANFPANSAAQMKSASKLSQIDSLTD